MRENTVPNSQLASTRGLVVATLDQHSFERSDRLGDTATANRSEAEEHAAGSRAEPVAASERPDHQVLSDSCVVERTVAHAVDPVDEHRDVQPG